MRIAWMFVVACSSRTALVPPASGGDGKTDDGNPVDAAPPAIWQPHPHTSWQWQLSGTIDTSIDASMYDLDLFDAPQPTIDALHAAGRVVICYFSAGSLESWRPDAGDFPANIVGNPLAGWPGEHWLDTRSPVVRDLMRARLDRAAAKHCDGVEPDNVDGYANSPGFPLTAATQLDYNRFLAGAGHARGLSVGLKNDLDQIPALVGNFDWLLDEQCFQYTECDTLAPFIDAGKAVFEVEYQGAASTICPDANARNFDTLIKPMALGPARTSCR